MSSKTDIANHALIMLGEQPIASLDVECKQSRIIKSIYNNVLDNLLCLHPWHFAKKTVLLAALNNGADITGKTSYQIPNDCLAILSVELPIDNLLPDITYQEKMILSYEQEGIYLLYVSRIDNPDLYPPEFKTLLSANLAEEIAYSLTGSPIKYDEARKNYNHLLKIARHRNALMTGYQFFPESSWIIARG